MQEISHIPKETKQNSTYKMEGYSKSAWFFTVPLANSQQMPNSSTVAIVDFGKIISQTAALELLQELVFLFFEKREIAMMCLIKYKWVKLPRDIAIDAKGRMTYYTRLATRAAFRKGMARYCDIKNPVEPGMWAGGIVGLKSILDVKKRLLALWIMNQLEDPGYLTWSLDPKTKLLTYKISSMLRSTL